MKWTTEKPNKPGYYWAYENLDECDADIFIVKFTEYGLKHKICSICGDPQFFHFDHFSHFVGPLEMPERPNKYPVYSQNSYSKKLDVAW